ncbi:MAG: gamma-glutamyl-gamma-aminobutyrate hydrolase family protein [candidate division KSB1 bacterium]|nr:gamma-glutamyl-gamma-aminobutyrate hydrolase family protein [candidate division KSB1 bacterium]
MNRQEQTAPLIGLTTYGRNRRNAYFLMAEYLEAVRQAGGVPVLLAPGEPRIKALLQRLDGLILAGGGDIAPDRFGRQGHPAVSQVDPERDDFELALARQWLDTRKPLLGICRGMQVLSVISGGDLILDIPTQWPSEIAHRREPATYVEHAVRIEVDSCLYRIVEQPEIMVASLHHQAVDRPGEGWRVSATAPDGIIEAMEHTSHPWALAVQWHPELIPEHPAHRRLFRALVHASASYALKRDVQTPVGKP